MENFSPGWKKNAITWEISARAETECEGGNRCFFIFIVVHKAVLRMRLWIFSPGWNFLSITSGISARSTWLKISSRVAQTAWDENPHVISPLIGAVGKCSVTPNNVSLKRFFIGLGNNMQIKNKILCWKVCAIINMETSIPNTLI